MTADEASQISGRLRQYEDIKSKIRDLESEYEQFRRFPNSRLVEIKLDFGRDLGVKSILLNKVSILPGFIQQFLMDTYQKKISELQEKLKEV